MFDPLLLKTFVAVVEEQGFGRAAEKLHLTQPAVSGHLRRLEEQVGKPLLKRTTRSQELTLEGDRLMRHARIILALNREAWAEMTRAPFQGRIRVGLAEDLVETRLLRELQNLALGYPGMEIEFQINIPGTLVGLMKQGELDLVVGSLCETDSSGILLWSEPLIWATAAQPLTPISEPLPLALFPEPCAYRGGFAASCTSGHRSTHVDAMHQHECPALGCIVRNSHSPDAAKPTGCGNLSPER